MVDDVNQDVGGFLKNLLSKTEEGFKNLGSFLSSLFNQETSSNNPQQRSANNQEHCAPGSNEPSLQEVWTAAGGKGNAPEWLKTGDYAGAKQHFLDEAGYVPIDGLIDDAFKRNANSIAEIEAKTQKKLEAIAASRQHATPEIVHDGIATPTVTAPQTLAIASNNTAVGKS